MKDIFNAVKRRQIRNVGENIEKEIIYKVYFNCQKSISDVALYSDINSQVSIGVGENLSPVTEFEEILTWHININDNTSIRESVLKELQRVN